MSLEERMKRYKEAVQELPREKKMQETKIQETKIQETINRSKAAFFQAEQEKCLSYEEFLWTQLQVLQKRWWVFQFIVLLTLWWALRSVQDNLYTKRSMGIAASLFVIFIIPELWRNRSCGCIEIEAASFYSLKQVYAARMLLFGMTDIFLILVFCSLASAGLHFEMQELTVQFLFPLCVTAGICFGILCSKHAFRETTAIALCLIWSAVWMFLILNENLYTVIALPVWLAGLGCVIFFIIISIYRILNGCNHDLEVSINEIRAE